MTAELHGDRIAVTVAEAVRLSGMSRSEIYRRLAASDLKGIKLRSRTLVRVDSIRAYLNSLPSWAADRL